MTYKFDKNKLIELLKDFYTISKITMSVWDSDFNQLTFYPNPMSPICTNIKSTPYGKKCCLDSDISACIKAASIKGPYTFTCHAGLIDTVVPIFYNDTLIAYIMFGQIRDCESIFSNIDKVKKTCKKYNIDEKEVDKYYSELPVFNHEQIEAISNLFTKTIPYFYASQTIKIEHHELASALDKYITNNITSPLSIEELCNEFNISANMLYQISHKHFNTSIKNYVINNYNNQR